MRFGGIWRLVMVVETGCIFPPSPGSASVSVSVASNPKASLSRAVLTSGTPDIRPMRIASENSENAPWYS